MENDGATQSLDEARLRSLVELRILAAQNDEELIIRHQSVTYRPDSAIIARSDPFSCLVGAILEPYWPGLAYSPSIGPWWSTFLHKLVVFWAIYLFGSGPSHPNPPYDCLRYAANELFRFCETEAGRTHRSQATLFVARTKALYSCCYEF